MLSTPWWIWPSSLHLPTVYPQALPFCMQTHQWAIVKLHLLLIFCSFCWCCLPRKPQSTVKNTAFLPWTLDEGKNTYISMLALKVKSIMGIKPCSWVTSMKQILIPRRAMVSGITLMHKSYDEGKNKEEKRNGPLQRIKLSDWPPLWSDKILHWTAVASL